MKHTCIKAFSFYIGVYVIFCFWKMKNRKRIQTPSRLGKKLIMHHKTRKNIRLQICLTIWLLENAEPPNKNLQWFGSKYIKAGGKQTTNVFPFLAEAWRKSLLYHQKLTKKQSWCRKTVVFIIVGISLISD